MSAGRLQGLALGISALNLTSKVLAIGKTMLIAAVFGAGAALDAFWVAYTLPLLLPALLTTVITVAFVPRFMVSLEGREGRDAWRGANTLFTVILGLSVAAALAMWPAAPWLVATLAPGLAPETSAEAARLTRWMLPCVPLLTLGALLASVCNARERFTLPALEGVLTNAAIIVAALALAPRYGVKALVLGVILGFIVHVMVLAWGNRDLLRGSLRPALAFNHPDFTGPISHVLPLLVGSAGSIVAGLISQYFLSLAGEGAIALMAYAAMFAFLPVEVFTHAVMNTHYPGLGRHFAAGEFTQAGERFMEGLRFLMALTLPAAVLLLLYAKPMVALLLERGAFSAGHTRQVALLIAILSIAMVFRSVAYLAYRVLHAARMPWRQVAIGLVGVGTHLVLCAVLVQPLGVAGIALATVVSAMLIAVVATAFVQRLTRLAWRGRHGTEFARLLVMVLGMLVGGLLLLELVGFTGLAGTARHWASAAAAVATCGLGLGLAWLLRQPDLMAIVESLVASLRRTFPRPSRR